MRYFKHLGWGGLLVLVLSGVWLLPVTPAPAQMAPLLIEKPAEAKPEAKKEEPPTTCGPMVSDTCLPIEAHKFSMQMLWAYSVYGGNFSPNWRRVTNGGDFSTFYMPLKVTYGPAKNWETYVVVPYIQNFANSVSPSPVPSGETSANYAGVGDISWFNKYLLLPETDCRPAVTGVFGVGFPSGHAHNLNPRFLGTDAVGSGAFTFTSGVNLYKWLKPFLVYSNIWFSAPINLYHDRPDTVRSREYMTFNVAAEYPLAKKWVLLLEMYSTWTWTTISTPQGYQSPYTVVGVLPALEFLATSKLSLATGAAIDLFGKGGPYKYTPMFTMYYTF